jgi:tetratricopeptide (TPR) repeat protein
MSLLLDALKKAAEQKEAKAEAAKAEPAITETVNVFDKTSVMEDTHTEIDNTVIFDENRMEPQEDETIALADESKKQSKENEAVVDETDLTPLQVDDTEVLGENENKFEEDEDITQVIEPPESHDHESFDIDVTVPNYDEDVTKIAPNYELDSDVTLESTELIDSQAGNDSVESEDMSLTLMESADPTLTQAKGSDETSLLITDTLMSDTTIIKSQNTDVERTDTEEKILAQANDPTVELNLDDSQEHRASKNDTATNRLADLNEPIKEDISIPQDSTLNQNYAPDNYDRTLIKIDRDDASQLFSGMKSESDALMTPEYARKVFINNSSIQRFNRYKIYSGVAASIMLIIFIFGLFEYEEKSLNIDNSLKSLKRDPMPNSFQLSDTQEPIKSLIQSESLGVDTKTIELVENADESSSVTSQQTKVTAEVVKVREAIKTSDIAIDANEGNLAVGEKTLDPAKINVTENERLLVTVSKKEVTKKPSRLQLSSKTAFTDKDTLLKDAYATYQRGDNSAALEKYNRVLADDPQNRNALLARAAIKFQNNDRNSAIKDYQTLLMENPKDSLAMSSLISVASISPSKSESQLKQMIRDEPLSPYLNFALGNVYGSQNRWHEAQGLFFKALKNNATDPNYAYNLAVSLEHISKPKVAITYYQLALNNFNNGLATFNKSLVEQRLEILKQL